jgi:hypothetical protein
MKNKNIFLITIFTILMLLVVSCSRQSTNNSVSTEELPPAEVNTTSNQVETAPQVPVNSTNLMMATFQLEKTEHAITVEQAEELLPLWKVYQNLVNSDTAAEAEREALINQIAGVMTEEQMAYLESDELDPQETMALMAEYGIEMQGGMGMGNRPNGEGDDQEMTDAQREEMQTMRETIGGGEGGPGGGMGGGMGQDIDPEQLATMQAERAAEGGGVRGGGQMDTILLPALMELLESKL